MMQWKSTKLQLRRNRCNLKAHKKREKTRKKSLLKFVKNCQVTLRKNKGLRTLRQVVGPHFVASSINFVL